MAGSVGKWWNDLLLGFSFGSDLGPRSYGLVVWSVAGGIALAVALITAGRLTTGRFIRSLIRKGAFSPETALPLSDCEGVNLFLRPKLKEKSTLRRVVAAVCPDDPKEKEEKNEKPEETAEKQEKKGKKSKNKRENAGELRYYIPEELKTKAETLYGAKTNPILAAAAILLIFAAAAGVMYIIPDFLTMVTNFKNHFFG